MGEKYEVRKKSDGGYTVEQVPTTAEQIGGGIALIYLFRWPLAILFMLGGSIIVCVGIYQLITMPFTAKTPPTKPVLQQSTPVGNSVIATVSSNGALNQATPQEPAHGTTTPIGGRITQNVKLHSKPGINEPTITVLKAGTQVVLTGDSVTTADGITWNKVQVGQQEGWCSAKFISPASQGAQASTDVNISGAWEGVITNPDSRNVFLDYWQLTQTGTTVDGTVRVEIQGNPAAHVSKRIHGTITNGVFRFEEFSFIETGDRPGEGLKWCLSSGEVQVKTEGNTMVLEGTFGAGHGSDACPATPTATVRAHKKP